MRLIAMLMLMVSTGWAQQTTYERVPMRVEGLFSDWQKSDLVAEDPAGDASGAFDVTKVFARSEGTRLFLRFDVGQVINIQSGPKEQGTLKFRIFLGKDREYVIDLRGRQSFLVSEPDKILVWSRVGFMTAPTFASTEFEMRVDLAGFGLKTGDVLKVQLAGSDELDKPFKVELEKGPPARPERRTDCFQGTSFRVASFNTLRDGLLDRKRHPAIRRLVRSVDPDILCLQEEYKIRKEAKVLREVIGGRWNACRNRDCIIASPHPVKSIAARLGRCAAALVMLPDSPILVINTHPHAAGYIGNKNDRKRVTEMTRVAAFIEEFRKGTFEKGLAKYRDAPVICVGDWNLVGSRRPLDVLIDKKGPGLVDWLLDHLAGESTATWRELEKPGSPRGGGFAPGRLDLVTYCPKRLQPRNGFILDSARLSGALLKKLKIKRKDSLCSDHLMMVSDFSLRTF